MQDNIQFAGHLLAQLWPIGFLILVCVVLCFSLKPRIFVRDAKRQIAAHLERYAVTIISCRDGGFFDYLRFGMHSQNFIYVLRVLDRNGRQRDCWVILGNDWFRWNYRLRLVWKDDPDGADCA